MIRFHLDHAFPGRLSLRLASAQRRFDDLEEHILGELRPRLRGLARWQARLSNSELLSFAFFVFLIALTFVV